MIIRTINVENPFIPDNNVIKTVTNDNNLQFSSLLKDALNKVNALQLQSDEYKQLLATGDVDNLHDVNIAAEKASIALQLTLAIRNKVVEAYQEIMRMQV
jgi:flagellar hook-basal body complex protein FliE